MQKLNLPNWRNTQNQDILKRGIDERLSWSSSTGQRLTFYHCATLPTEKRESVRTHVIWENEFCLISRFSVRIWRLAKSIRPDLTQLPCHCRPVRHSQSVIDLPRNECQRCAVYRWTHLRTWIRRIWISANYYVTQKLPTWIVCTIKTDCLNRAIMSCLY